jgi:hypothetical protein
VRNRDGVKRLSLRGQFVHFLIHDTVSVVVKRRWRWRFVQQFEALEKAGNDAFLGLVGTRQGAVKAGEEFFG